MNAPTPTLSPAERRNAMHAQHTLDRIESCRKVGDHLGRDLDGYGLLRMDAQSLGTHMLLQAHRAEQHLIDVRDVAVHRDAIKRLTDLVATRASRPLEIYRAILRLIEIVDNPRRIQASQDAEETCSCE